MYQMKSNVTQYLEAAVDRHPNKVAFESRHRSITFRNVQDEAKNIAANIQRLTSNKVNSPVAVYLPKSVDSIVCFIAAAYSGNFYAPLDISVPTPKLMTIFNILEPIIVLTDKSGATTLDKLDLPYHCLDISDTNTDDRYAEVNSIDTDPLYVKFTSGSTGVPKGVLISHKAVIDYTEWLADTFRFSENTIFGNQAPFYFDNSILDIYSTLRNCSKMIIIPEENFLLPSKLLSYVIEKDINTIFWVPTALMMVANTDALVRNTPSKLKQILFCGEVMPCKHLNVWIKSIPDALYANLYGPTEITDVCTYYIINRRFKDSDVLPIGKPCANTRVIILNEQNEQVTGTDIGELCVIGTCLSIGYYNDFKKTDEVFVQNPLVKQYYEKIYRTGDLVHYNEFGELMFDGRKDYQIKHLGYRIELGEIEAVALSHDGIKQCCVLYDQKEQKLILVASPDSIDKKQLYQHLKKHLSNYMLPASIELMDALPLNQNGKIDRLILKQSLIME